MFGPRFETVEKDFKALTLNNYRPVWQPFMRKYNCNYVCEIGISNGENFRQMIAHKPKLAVAVDNHDFTKIVEKLPSVKTLKQEFGEAANEFRDRYFDFVFLNAQPSVTGYYKYLTKWYPKVKYGKFMAGSNYVRGRNVAEAVDIFVQEKNLKLMWRPPSIWAVVKT